MGYNFKDVRVLVVESSPQLFSLFKNVLRMFTVPDENIDSAYSMEEGWKKFKEGNHDLIIVDWLETPDRGIQLTQIIRHDSESPNPYVPVLMTAGSGHLSRVKKARDGGVSDFLVKPFTAKTLADKLTRIIEKPRPFVLSDEYTGPDRRIRQESFGFPGRREADTGEMDLGFREKEKQQGVM